MSKSRAPRPKRDLELLLGLQERFGNIPISEAIARLGGVGAIGNNDIAHAISLASKAMHRANADLRAADDRKASKKNGNTFLLKEILRSDRPLDRGDREMLADLVTGLLGHESGDRGPAYGNHMKREAEWAARVEAAKTGKKLEDAAEAVVQAAKEGKTAAGTVVQDWGLTKHALYNFIRRPAEQKFSVRFMRFAVEETRKEAEKTGQSIPVAAQTVGERLRIWPPLLIGYIDRKAKGQ